MYSNGNFLFSQYNGYNADSVVRQASCLVGRKVIECPPHLQSDIPCGRAGKGSTYDQNDLVDLMKK